MTQSEPDKELAQYYEQLGLTPDASLQDIRAAYSRLYLAPDSDSSNTAMPLKNLKAAYEKLNHPDQGHSAEAQDSLLKPNPLYLAQPGPGEIALIFDPGQMQGIRDRLEQDYQAIEANYRQTCKNIDEKKKRRLEEELLDAGLWDGITPTNAWVTTIIALLMLAPALWLIFSGAWWVWSLLAILWSTVWGLAIIGVWIAPRITPSQAKRLKPIQDEIQELEAQAQADFERQKKAFEQHQQEQVAYFVSLAPEIITDSFIQSLTPLQQFYLLKAIHQRQDQAAIKRNLKTGAKLLVGAGLLTALFTGLPFF